MKKYVLISIVLSMCSFLYAQAYQLQYKGLSSSTEINGYVRDASFYNDTCYFISGDGKRIMLANLDGRLLHNNFSGITFDEAMMLHVNDSHVIVLENTKISFYTKQGQFVRRIPLPDPVNDSYFFVMGKESIMVATDSRVLLYSYSTGAIIAQKTPTMYLESPLLHNDGQKLYHSGQNLMVYEVSGDSILETNATTPRYSEYYNNNYYLACLANNEVLWFEYFKRDKLYVMDSSFTSITGVYSLLPISQKPTDEDLYIESGDPALKIIFCQNKVYVLNTSSDTIAFYQLI